MNLKNYYLESRKHFYECESEEESDNLEDLEEIKKWKERSGIKELLFVCRKPIANK
ncbi:hypothetical protein CWI38_0076p0050 [Hamiltosporidium tvaerminnensis]|uniref:Uncharacterized protein n=1 Tax=Hamiltosporidium tvaerminnensis TaxID=1176355 RepID=A0A4Q9M3V0_9MICR|nr:hypothetical protein CWI38_0076p0050 [Hamiltosporidium tvaerminnensis]